jgi:hypothetical protein
MAKLTLIFAWLVLGTVGSVLAASIGTQWEGLAHSIAGKIDSYVKTHDDTLPPNLAALFSDGEMALLEEQLRGPLSSKVQYFGSNSPTLSNDGQKLLAVVSFPIIEDRREGAGRYVIYASAKGKIGSRWETEEVIQQSAKSAGLPVSTGPVFEERPLKVLYPEYGIRLIEEAVKSGVPAEKAADIVQRHIDEVNQRRANEVATWSDLLGQAEKQSNPMPVPPLAAETQTKPTPVHNQTPTPTASAKSKPEPSGVPVVPVTIIAVVIAGILLFILRRKST